MVATRRDLSLGFGRSLDHLFQDVFGAFTQNAAPTQVSDVFPALNVWQDEAAFQIESEVPGVKLQDLELTVNGREFVLSGERKRNEADKAVHSERIFGKFERRLRLPEDIDSEHVVATLENGVLHVTLPKAASARQRRIEIQAR